MKKEEQGGDLRYGKSKITGELYKITEWKDVGEPEDGKQKVIAEEKEPVERSKVPDEVLEKLGEQKTEDIE